MADIFSADKRTSIMQKVKTRNTSCEIQVRKILWSSGYRYRLHVKSLPGTPDIVFGKLKKIIFVHGCFWHGHNCPRGKHPTSNTEFWEQKISDNTRRDEAVIRELNNMGWSVLTIWQCEISKIHRDELLRKVDNFMAND